MIQTMKEYVSGYMSRNLLYKGALKGSDDILLPATEACIDVCTALYERLKDYISSVEDDAITKLVPFYSDVSDAVYRVLTVWKSHGREFPITVDEAVEFTSIYVCSVARLSMRKQLERSKLGQAMARAGVTQPNYYDVCDFAYPTCLTLDDAYYDEVVRRYQESLNNH